MSQERSSPVLVVRHTGQVFRLGTAELHIGSHEDNAIILGDPRVSPRHATIFWQAETGAHLIRDLDSAQGTYVNGVRLQAPQVLHDGDSIRMGNTVMDLRMAPVPGSGDADTPPPSGRSGVPSLFKSPILAGLLVAGLAGITILCVGLLVVLLLTGGKGTPTVVIQSPSYGAQVSEGNQLVLQATASGASDIIRLEVRVDGSLVAMASEEDGTSTLTVKKTWRFTTAGEHLVTADAYTASGKNSERAAVRVTILAPTASPTPTSEPDTPTPTITPSPTPTPTATPTPTSLPPPQIEYFQSSPASIVAGNCTTLQWGKVNYATRASIEPDLGGVATPGSQIVCPVETTAYVLTATGPGGTTQAQTTVTVIGDLPDLTIDTIRFVPSPPRAGQDNEVQITIRNRGTGIALAFSWEWKPGSSESFRGRVYGLEPGETSVVRVLWRPSQPYDRLTTVALVDGDGQVLEAEEDNNKYTAVVRVLEPEINPVTVHLSSEGDLDGYWLNDGTGISTKEILVGNADVVIPTGELVARGLLSFDLSEIPAGATIESAELRFYQREIEGEPYQKLGNLVLEHVYYGTTWDGSAYDTPALATAVLAMETSPEAWYILSDPTIVDWVQFSLEESLSRQQFRLRFDQETDGDGQEDWIAIPGGGGILPSPQAPQLVITFVP